MTKLTLAIFACLVLVGCEQEKQTADNKPQPQYLELPTPTPDKKPEQKFNFNAQDGKDTQAAVFNDPNTPGRKVVIFLPFLKRTDGNFYLAALETLWNVYGKERGAFLFEDSKEIYHPVIKAKAICWEVYNPTQDYCVLPVRDTKTGKIGYFYVWLN